MFVEENLLERRHAMRRDDAMHGVECFLIGLGRRQHVDEHGRLPAPGAARDGKEEWRAWEMGLDLLVYGSVARKLRGGGVEAE